MSRREKMRWEIVISICIFEIYFTLGSHIGTRPARPIRDVDIRCRLTPHYTWKCECWEKNVYLMLGDNSDFAFVCNSDYELQVVQNGARSRGNDEGPHHRDDYGRDGHGREYDGNIDHSKADDFRQKSYDDDFERKWRDYKDTMPSGASGHRDAQAEDIYNELNGIFPKKYGDEPRLKTTPNPSRERVGDNYENYYNTNDRENEHKNLMSLLKPSYDDRQPSQQNTGDYDKDYKNNDQHTTTYDKPENNDQQNEASENNFEQSQTTTTAATTTTASNEDQQKLENTSNSNTGEKQSNGDILIRGSVYNPKTDFYKISNYKGNKETEKPTTTEQTTTTTTTTTKAPTTTTTSSTTTTTKKPPTTTTSEEVVVDDEKCKWQGKLYSQGEEINLFGLAMIMGGCKYLCREHGHIKKECQNVPTFYGKKDTYFPG